MRGQLEVRRRRPRATPLSTRRLGPDSAVPALPAGPFPGFADAEDDEQRRRWISGSVATLLHGGIVAGLLLYAWLNPPVIEEIIPVELLKEEAPKPKPPPPAPVAKVEPRPAPAPAPTPPRETPAPVPKENPAPAPKALAERRTASFAPQAQAIAPQVVNPSVVATAAPAIDAKKLEGVGPAVAPREIAHPTSVATVSALPSIAPAQASKIDLGGVTAPALRGPIDAAAPVGQSVGPRQVVTSGGTVGTGTQATNLGGSSVREGIVTGRDVVGSPDGPRLASIDTRVGTGNMQGDGGTGAGQAGGGAGPGCTESPEAEAYKEQVRVRMLSRWTLPDDVESNQAVRLRFKLDAAGSVLSAEVVGGGDPRLNQSAVDALRSASPFPPMNDRVRCMAGQSLTGIFKNPRVAN
ncbi:MAG: TonB family protein [Deltaproteobacteria bacterium]|nr:TonB family protein [Deltaproteobacteria bacterium]